MQDTMIIDGFSRVTEKVVTWGQEALVLLPNMVMALLVIFVFVVVASYVRRGVRTGANRAHVPANVGQLLATTARVAVIVIGIMVALDILNLDKTVTSVLAGIGVAGLALGFAFQNVASNFIAGIIMAFNPHAEIGDLVEIDGKMGEVVKTSLRSITLQMADGSLFIVPNKRLFENSFTNYSDRAMRRVDISVGVSYDDDLDQVERVVRATIEQLPQVTMEKPMQFLYTDFAESSINFEVRFWIPTNDYFAYLEARNAGIKAIKKVFDTEGISIPYPTRTLIETNTSS